MITPDYARTMARYNRWQNEKLYAHCAALSDADRKADMGAFFRSIHGTLNHLLVADRIWMGRFVGPAFRPPSLAHELFADFEDLRRERAVTDGAIEAFAAGITEPFLGRTLEYMSIVNPAPQATPMARAVAHFFNHQTHHRGQVTTLLFQRGIDPGVTDLMWLDMDRPVAPR